MRTHPMSHIDLDLLCPQEKTTGGLRAIRMRRYLVPAALLLVLVVPIPLLQLGRLLSGFRFNSPLPSGKLLNVSG
jgi:hypothetical protein